MPAGGGANVPLRGRGPHTSRFRFNRSARHDADHRFAPESAASDTAQSAAEGIGNAASAAAAHGLSGLSAVYEGIGCGAGRRGDVAGRLLRLRSFESGFAGVRREAENLQQTLGEFFDDKPLALGIFGLAIGAGLAAPLPQTDAERRLMGEASDAAMKQAGSMVAAKIDQIPIAGMGCSGNKTCLSAYVWTYSFKAIAMLLHETRVERAERRVREANVER